ncbi:MAG: Crp/Fnr family transcriptional regulator [Alistipes sp.]|jgi:CRP-like cAMP-binding protein|nr:Crp/Fnr family transcriptional regulator [Alistipes sp.]
METLKKLLSEECKYRLPEGLADEFLDSMTEVDLKSGEILIPYGRMDDNVYVVKAGIIRYCYFDGDREKTFSFWTPGNVAIQYHCYYKGLPSFFQLESCGRSTVMRVSKSDMEGFVARSHEFSRWMLSLSLEQLYTNDMKLSIINGTAKERFIALAQNRRQIMERVPLKVIASYLGITPQYLSQLRKAYFKVK